MGMIPEPSASIARAKSFGEFGEFWLQKAPMADSTRAMRRSIWVRELEPF